MTIAWKHVQILPRFHSNTRRLLAKKESVGKLFMILQSIDVRLFPPPINIYIYHNPARGVMIDVGDTLIHSLAKRSQTGQKFQLSGDLINDIW